MTRADPRIGQRLGGRFVLERPLGSGGAGMVYEARQEDLGRKVAVKLLRPELAADPGILERFRREARAAAALGHPHIAQVLDFAEPKGDEPAFIVFELVPGESLHALIGREATLRPERAVTLATQVLAGLEAAHRAGIVHRDLKPANVYIANLAGVGESAKILDFGIARVMEGEAYRRLTATGVIIGTPRYMSPEQVSGTALDPRSDLWSVGVMLYRMLTGRMPYDGTSAELVGAILRKPTPPMPPEARVPPALEAAVARALAKSPNERWQSAPAMAHALRLALQGAGAGHGNGVGPAVAGASHDEAATVREARGAAPRARAEVALPRTRAPVAARLEEPAASAAPAVSRASHERPVRSSALRVAVVGALSLAALAAALGSMAYVSGTAGPAPGPLAPEPTVTPIALPPETTLAPPTPEETPPPLPDRASLEELVARGARIVGGTVVAVEVVASGLDRATGALDLREGSPAALDVVYRSTAGACSRYQLTAVRIERVEPVEQCGDPLVPPFVAPTAFFEAGARRCSRFDRTTGPVNLRLWYAGTNPVDVTSTDVAIGFTGTSDGWGEIEVRARDCRGEPRRPAAAPGGEMVNPWAGGSDGEVDPWAP